VGAEDDRVVSYAWDTAGGGVREEGRGKREEGRGKREEGRAGSANLNRTISGVSA
jgi:hypothetical protein